MFDEQADQTEQTQNTGDQGTTAGAPSIGLGVNPNPTFSDPTGSAASATAPATLPTAPTQSDATATAAPNELQDIKRQALAQLSPLVGHLDQTPEEKYKTLMMMIQASDNQDLISEAYEAAQKITDEKVKAEALLNIVNEINYFTQPKNQ